ncbi:hypothetical protein JMJ58_03755 [Haloterrigena salifodinae]|uniref:Uncharacterized protein n=1 Tax=Haloterrigena salifodinae TaxID=2675099 RepID=A0A8T8E2D8_9EURY|nr:hypothetical protein [Haloterrigena salifodinae]QRV16024.1 hypothetical protein JMJ58_03755 [Haloterrigena salifodinae]
MAFKDSIFDLVSLAVENPTVTVGILSIIAGAIYYRLSNLEDPRDREQYIIKKFDDRQWIEYPLKAEFDTLHLVESSGWMYKFKRLLFGYLDGETAVSLYTNFTLDEEMWEYEEFMQPYHEMTNCEVEYIRCERINSEKVQMIFEFDSIDHNEIAHAIFAFLKFMKSADETVEGVEIGPPQFNK